MADAAIKISELPEASAASGEDVVVGVQGNATKKFLLSTLSTWLKSQFTKSDIGLGNVDNTADADKPISTATQAALNGKVDTSSVGVAGGVASLDSAGKVPSSQLPSYVDDVLAALLNHDNYKAVMKAWFKSKGSAAMTDFTELCDEWYELTRTGWSGGVRFQIPAADATANSDGARTGDNVGMSCTPSTLSVAGQDDFADVPLFFPVDCNVYLDANGDPHITAIDGVCGDFARTDASRIVCVMQMTGWERFVVDSVAGVYGWDYTDQPNKEDYYPLPEAVSLYDNRIRNFVVHGKYNFGDTWSCCSGQKVRIWDVSHNSQLSGVRSQWGTRYCGATSADDAFLKLMLYLKYARLDSGRILAGCVNYSYVYQLALGETGVERVLLTPAQASNLIVGSCICVGTSTSRSGSKANDTALLDRVRIVQIDTIEIDGVSYGAVYVDNGGTTFDTSTSYYVYTFQWHTGSTDDVLGNDGGINPASPKYPVKLQGIEYMVGCYEAMGDIILSYGSQDDVNRMIPNVCRDATKLATSLTSDYMAGRGTPTPASAGWQYPKQMYGSTSAPELIWAIDTGGSTSGGPRDGIYMLIVTSGVYEWLRFGRLSHGVGGVGLSCGLGNYGLSYAHWYVGGRLSVTGNRGEFQAAA